MKLSNRSFAIITIVAVGAICFALAAWNNGWFKSDKPIAQTGDEPANNADEDKPPQPGWLKTGGVWRPPSDIRSVRKRDLDRTDRKGHDWGRSESVDPETNANTKSIKQAIGNKDLAYRLSSMQPAPPFDREAYEKNPQKYLDEIAPGRINQSLQPGPRVVSIKRKGKYLNTLVQGESVVLAAKVEPQMPVTFHSPRLGNFENKLTSITVRADETGIAKATYTASAGTHGEIDLRASSPVHSDVARWLVDVVKPVTTENTKVSQNK